MYKNLLRLYYIHLLDLDINYNDFCLCRYTRLDLTERYRTPLADQVAKRWNDAVGRAQKIRLQPILESDDADDVFSVSEDVIDAADFAAGDE